MNEKIVEIIIFVISELKQNKQMSEIDISGLLDLGYTNSEISTALSWIVDKVEFSDNTFFDNIHPMEGSFRILHSAESELFTKSAWGELIQLNSLGIISAQNIETLIEKAAMMGLSKIDNNQLKSYIANIVFQTQVPEYPGSRIMLSGSDLIN